MTFDEYIKLLRNKARTQPLGEFGQRILDLYDFKTRSQTSLTWLVKDAKWRFDIDKGSMDEGSNGGYSPEMIEASKLLDDLKGAKSCEK